MQILVGVDIVTLAQEIRDEDSLGELLNALADAYAESSNSFGFGDEKLTPQACEFLRIMELMSKGAHNNEQEDE